MRQQTTEGHRENGKGDGTRDGVAPRGVIAPESEHMRVVSCEHEERVFGGCDVESALNGVIQSGDLLQRSPPVIVVVGVVYTPS